MNHRKVTRRSWGSRLGGSFRGIVLGLLCLAVASWFLFWNEGRAVQRYRALQEGSGIVVSVDAASRDPENEGKLVHLSGVAESHEFLTDDSFDVSIRSIHLERQVEMYQWRERSDSREEKKVGGSTETVTDYSYEKVWHAETIDSSRFEIPAGHENPGYFPYPNRRVSARNVSLGAFQLPPQLVSRIASWEPVSIRIEDLPSELRWKSHPYEGGIFLGRNPASPTIGDLRVNFRVVPNTRVSIVARQAGQSLEPYVADGGESIQLLRMGAVGADSMFAGAQRSNRVQTWVFRFLGFLVMFFGFSRVFRPLSVMGDVIPVIGNALEKGTSSLSFLLAMGLSGLIIAVAWLYYRPLIAISLLILVALAVLGVLRLLMRARRPAAPPPPPAPAE